ncbi:MAG: hypothetical protein COB10_09520 [Planctomycetota bacterium]|nr:MAG: hypothetical protein COB10_09520 [Planctomycetota bacterium]
MPRFLQRTGILEDANRFSAAADQQLAISEQVVVLQNQTFLISLIGNEDVIVSFHLHGCRTSGTDDESVCPAPAHRCHRRQDSIQFLLVDLPAILLVRDSMQVDRQQQRHYCDDRHPDSHGRSQSGTNRQYDPHHRSDQSQ